MLSASWDSLSLRDSIEFFSVLLRLEVLFPGILIERSNNVLNKITSDHRSGYRQDSISKAVIIEKLADAVRTDELLVISKDARQDLDTRNIALRILWNRPSVPDEVIVPVVRDFLKELIPLALKREEPAPAFIVGLAFLLLRYRHRSAEDKALIMNVYSYYHPEDPTADWKVIEQWFRVQATIGGLVREPIQRG
jgi:hypothetical protein